MLNGEEGPASSQRTITVRMSIKVAPELDPLWSDISMYMYDLEIGDSFTGWAVG